MVFESESIELFFTNILNKTRFRIWMEMILQVVGLNLQLSDQAWVTMEHFFEYVLFKCRMNQLVLSIPIFF